MNSFKSLLAAIVDDDRAKVKRLLKTEPALTAALVKKPRLYTSGIQHWMYVNDTALHLAAAGHRGEIVRLLLASGADVNAARNHRAGAPLHYAADGYVVSPDWKPNEQVKTIRALIA